MTPEPWVVTTFTNQTLITDEDGNYIALLHTRLEGRWTMDPGDLRLLIASAKLLKALENSTAQLTRLKTRHPDEVGLDIYIEHNRRLIRAI